MIRFLSLYYLNIKPTHGYEIQKFLQVSGADAWTKIQSGSIYYALSKLEKEGFIQVLQEERTGARVRKIYQITESGKEELLEELQKELLLPIVPICSDKFFIQNMMNVLSKDRITSIVEKHLTELQEQLEYWKKWKEIKVNDSSLLADTITFEMTIESIKYQILWHEEIIKNLEQYIARGEEMKNLIYTTDFSDFESNEEILQDQKNKTIEIEKLKEEILSNPTTAAENIDKLIKKLKN